MTDLKPCPFCGSSGEFYPDGDMEGHTIMCSGDKLADLASCPLTTFGYTTAEIATQAWNTRAAAAMAVQHQTPAKNEGHGHVRPRPDGVKARCGGPAFCRVCQQEAAAMAGEKGQG